MVRSPATEEETWNSTEEDESESDDDKESGGERGRYKSLQWNVGSWSSLLFCSDGGNRHGILCWLEVEGRKKAFRQGVLDAPAVTPEQQSSLMERDNNPPLSRSLYCLFLLWPHDELSHSGLISLLLCRSQRVELYQVCTWLFGLTRNRDRVIQVGLETPVPEVCCVF